MDKYEMQVAIAEMKGVLKELQRISIRAELNLAWDNIRCLPEELVMMKKLIKSLDGRIKELETQNEDDEDDLY